MPTYKVKVPQLTPHSLRSLLERVGRRAELLDYEQNGDAFVLYLSYQTPLDMRVTHQLLKRNVGWYEAEPLEEDATKRFPYRIAKAFVTRAMLWVVVLKFLSRKPLSFQQLKEKIELEWVKPKHRALWLVLRMMKYVSYISAEKVGGVVFYKTTEKGKMALIQALADVRQLTKRLTNHGEDANGY